MQPSYFRYWGKARKQDEHTGDDYHLLPYHCLDVAAVGWWLLSDRYPWCRTLAAELGVEQEQLRRVFVFFLALHDVGKFSCAFQGVVPGLSSDLVPAVAGMPYSIRHDSLGFLLWLRSGSFQQAMAQVLALELRQVKRQTHLDIWFQVVTGHHGQPPKGSAGSVEQQFLVEDEQAAAAFVTSVAELYLTEADRQFLLDKTLRESLRQVSWQLAGLAVLSDWIGSNQHYFSYSSQPQPLSRYWDDTALICAERALAEAPLGALGCQPFESIQQLFPYVQSPTPLQCFTQDHPLADGPQLLILEDVTGAGKTEAAMVLVHRLMSAGLADGLYVGLPTMATANAMYERLGRCYQQLFPPGSLPSLVLSHGSRHLSDAFAASIDEHFSERIALSEQDGDRGYHQDEPSASAYCNAWIADSRKKALFANVGVGTIDQALLAVLPVRHQSLRLLGLSRKVLLVDEVHAFDPYMNGLLQSLLELHAAQGGSAILLSATLPKQTKTGLLRAFAKGLGRDAPRLTSMGYPLVSHFPNGAADVEYPVLTRKEVERSVEVRALTDEEQVMARIQSALTDGKSVCWIRNTVDDARNSFERCTRELDADAGRMHLFHSRFAMADRLEIEKSVLSWFGDRSDAGMRRSRLLVSTQVVEQSLDLDFDLLITDLAPIDLLIQRAGRLHRHVRDAEGNRLYDGSGDQRGSALMYLHTPVPNREVDGNWLAMLRGTQAVYPDLGMLWRSAFKLLEKEGFRMPDDARDLIESVYSDETELDTPEALLDASFEADGKRRAERGMALFNRLDLSRGYSLDSNAQGWSEEVNVPTRLSDATFSVVLVVPGDDGDWTPYAGRARYGWDMSVVNLRESLWRQAEKAIPVDVAAALEQLRQRQPAVRWHQLFPLTDALAKAYDREQGWIGGV